MIHEGRARLNRIILIPFNTQTDEDGGIENRCEIMQLRHAGSLHIIDAATNGPIAAASSLLCTAMSNSWPSSR